MAAADRADAVELSTSTSDPEAPDTHTEQAQSLLNRSSDNDHQEEEAAQKAPPAAERPERGWRHHALGILIMLVLTAFGLAVAAYVLDLDDVFEGRKLSFLVVGDWGRNGQLNQTLVAAAMAREAKKVKPSFIISTGDNFYESGLTSAESEQFTTSFTDVYDDPSLQVPWFAILGNHDYGELWNVSSMPQPPDCQGLGLGATQCYYSPLHELNASLTLRDWRWHCERWYQRSMGRGAIEIFFIDTSPAISSYHEEVWAHNKGGILEESWEAQMLELEGRLAASKARWKLVVGHHPVLNNHWPPTPELLSLQPMFERYHVQAYFCGHEHMLQHLHASGDWTHYLVSGGGSLTDYGTPQLFDSSASQMQHAGSGFVSCSIDLEELRCKYFGLTDVDSFYSVTIPARRG